MLSSEQAERLCEIPADESFRFGKRISLSVEAVSVVGSPLRRGVCQGACPIGRMIVKHGRSCLMKRFEGLWQTGINLEKES